MNSDIWAHLADALKGYEPSLPPSGPDYLISDINAPLPETVEFDEVNGDPFLLYVNCLIAMPLSWSRMPIGMALLSPIQIVSPYTWTKWTGRGVYVLDLRELSEVGSYS